jgi:hypothetical protein
MTSLNALRRVSNHEVAGTSRRRAEQAQQNRQRRFAQHQPIAFVENACFYMFDVTQSNHVLLRPRRSDRSQQVGGPRMNSCRKRHRLDDGRSEQLDSPTALVSIEHQLWKARELRNNHFSLFE